MKDDFDLEKLHRDLMDLVTDEAFTKIADNLRYRPLSPGRPQGVILDPVLSDGNIPVSYAIVRLADALQPFISERKTDPRQFDIFESVQRLERVVPQRQNIAPVQFGIADGRLVVIDQKANAQDRDSSNIIEAKDQLENTGKKILEHLSHSNCDKRIIDNITELQEQISSGKNIVRLGLANVGCDIIVSQFSHEIPDAVSAMLKAHSVGISMYVAQFPEWRRFTEQAALVHLETADISVLRDATENIATGLSQAPEAADPEVPRVLNAFKHLLDNPTKASQRAIFAVWRSLENLVISVFNYSNSLFKQTAGKLADELSTKASKLIVKVLMASALAGAVSLTPIASHLPDGAWLGKATDIVVKQLEHLVAE